MSEVAMQEDFLTTVNTIKAKIKEIEDYILENKTNVRNLKLYVMDNKEEIEEIESLLMNLLKTSDFAELTTLKDRLINAKKELIILIQNEAKTDKNSEEKAKELDTRSVQSLMKSSYHIITPGNIDSYDISKEELNEIINNEYLGKYNANDITVIEGIILPKKVKELIEF